MHSQMLCLIFPDACIFVFHCLPCSNLPFTVSPSFVCVTFLSSKHIYNALAPGACMIVSCVAFLRTCKKRCFKNLISLFTIAWCCCLINYGDNWFFRVHIYNVLQQGCNYILAIYRSETLHIKHQDKCFSSTWITNLRQTFHCICSKHSLQESLFLGPVPAAPLNDSRDFWLVPQVLYCPYPIVVKSSGLRMADNPVSPIYNHSWHNETVGFLWAGTWCESCLEKDGSGEDQRCIGGL